MRSGVALLVMCSMGAAAGLATVPGPARGSSSRGGVLILGGGPTGLGAAMMLSKRGYEVTVVERNMPGTFEKAKSYLYRINGVGQRLTDLIDVTPALAAVSVAQSEYNTLTRVFPNGDIVEGGFGIPMEGRTRDAYWLPRAVMLRLLEGEVARRHAGSVTLLHGAGVGDVKLEDGEVCVTVERGGREEVLRSSRVLACDGINSRTRRALRAYAESQGDKSSFAVKSFDSPSVGLRYKILTLRQGFPISRLNRTEAVNAVGMSYVGVTPRLSSDYKSDSLMARLPLIGWLLWRFQRFTPLRLGLLPVKSQDMPRTANIIAKEADDMWTKRDPASVLEYLQAQFPQVDIREMVDDEELERFAEIEPGRFPPCQWCTTASLVLPSGAGLALLGDALHAFPPDMGAGVNSALADVTRLNDKLDEFNDDWGKSLAAYNDEAVREARAVAQLTQVGFPFQYSQNLPRKYIKQLVIVLRLLLHKAVPILAPPVALLGQRENLSYSATMRWNFRTLTALRLLLVALLGLVLGRAVPLPRPV